MSQQRTKPDLSPEKVLANLVLSWIATTDDTWATLIIPRIQYDRAKALAELVLNKDKP